jgi:hypothetical protein
VTHPLATLSAHSSPMLRAPVRRRAAYKWPSTVRTEMPSRRATSLAVKPLTTPPSTSR